ncbi:DinB family protein [Carboxydochorda subterranea]|uniref:DinB family protein n=1 Tax=Carboxydichorda subterranea TaxID=3109565 RepID=A0ABZ1BU96_9FIRM|nr:DinB family protein [Limnochorda sp. L945t]WRP16055.1 DinB family protein [Limnochorda sp. L945t]
MGLIPEFVLRAMSERPFQLIELCHRLPDGWWTWQPHPRVMSIRTILVHMMEAEESWVSHIVKGEARPDRRSSAFASPDVLEAVWRPVRARTVEWLASLDESARTEKRRIPGTPTEVTLEAIAWHLVTHDFHHKGQVCTRLAMLGVEVPDLDII